MRRFLMLLLMTGTAVAQTTTYTGTIKDLSLNVVTSGQVTFTLAPPTDSTIPGIGRFTPTTITCNINSDGTLSGFVGGVVSGACLVASNTALSPTGTSYRICIQPQFAIPGSCFFDYAVTTSKDISTVAPTLSTGPVNFAGPPGPPGPAGPSGPATQAGFFSAASFAGTFSQLVVDSTTASRTITVSTTMSVTANTTVSADRSINVLSGGLLSCSAGVTITFQGDFYADPSHQAFSGCTIQGLKWARPEWFGTQAIRKAINSLSSVGGTVFLQNAVYTSDYTAASPLVVPNITILGMKEPDVDSVTLPTKLVNGSIIQGLLGAMADYLTIRNVGIDVGSVWTAAFNAGVPSDGLALANVGQVVGRPQFKRPQIENVIALSNSPTAAIHALLIENVDRAFVHNVTGWFAGHCFAYKGTNGVIDGFYSKGCQFDGFTMKSDDYAPATKTNISNGIITASTPGDSGGFTIQAAEIDAANININNVQVFNTTYGIQLLADAGTIRNVNIDNFTADNTGFTSSGSVCAIFTGTATVTNMNKISFDNFNCLNVQNGMFTASISPLDVSVSNSKFSNIGTNVISTTGNWALSNLQIRAAGANGIVNNGGTVVVSSYDFTGVLGAFFVPTSGVINITPTYIPFTVNLTPTAVTAATCADQTFTATGLAGTERILGLNSPSALGNVSTNATTTAANTLKIHFCNPSAASVTPPAGPYTFLAVH